MLQASHSNHQSSKCLRDQVHGLRVKIRAPKDKTSKKPRAKVTDVAAESCGSNSPSGSARVCDDTDAESSGERSVSD